jgi:hypothetical protein
MKFLKIRFSMTKSPVPTTSLWLCVIAIGVWSMNLAHEFAMASKGLLWPLTPKRHPCHFVAYEWQWTSLGSRGRLFFIHWFLGQLVRPVVHYIQLKNHHGRSSSLCKNEFCEKNKWPCSVFIKFSLYLLKLNLSHKYDFYLYLNLTKK